MKYNFNGFTTKANEALNSAISLAESLGHTYVGSEHLLLGLLKLESGVAFAVLNRNNINFDEILNLIKNDIGYGTPTKLSPDHFTPRAKKVIETAMSGCNKMGKQYVGTEHILLGLLGDGDNYAIRFIKALGGDIKAISTDALSASGFDTNMNNYRESSAENEKADNSKLENLSKFGIDLTNEAKSGKLDPVLLVAKPRLKGLFKFFAEEVKTTLVS